MIDPLKFARLREMLDTAKVLADVMNYFFDHFAENPTFLGLGQPEEVPILTAVIEQVLSHGTKKTAKLLNARYIRIAKLQFVHGPLMVQGQLGSVIYFEDTGKGVVAFPGKGGSTNFARFSTVDLGDAKDVELN